MKRIVQNQKIYLQFARFFFGLLTLSCLCIVACNSNGKYSFSDKVKASSWDGSVDVVETFLKKHYLRDPDSYKSVEWGKLIKNSDGSFQVSHRFSAKNGFGGVNTETLLFCISEDGGDVHICSTQDEKRIIENEQKSQETIANKEYIDKDFTNTLFEGVITETIDGLDEKCTFKGNLSKVENVIQGNLEAVEKEINYRLTGNIKDEGKVEFKLENLSNGSVIQITGFITAYKLSAYSNDSNISFYLKQSE